MLYKRLQSDEPALTHSLAHFLANNWHTKKLRCDTHTHTTLQFAYRQWQPNKIYLLPFKCWKCFDIGVHCQTGNNERIWDNNSTHVIKQNDLGRESKQWSRFDINATNMRERMRTTHTRSHWHTTKPSLWRRQQKPHSKERNTNFQWTWEKNNLFDSKCIHTRTLWAGKSGTFIQKLCVWWHTKYAWWLVKINRKNRNRDLQSYFVRLLIEN